MLSIGVRVNCVLPGFTDTTILSDVPEKVLKQLLKMTPLKRMAQPEGNIKFTISYNGKK